MKLALFALCFFTITNCFSQYYFNEIVTQQQSAEQYKLLRLNKIRKITVTNYDGNGEVIPKFEVNQEMNNDGKELITTTILNDRKQIITNSYLEGKLQQSIQDNAKILVTTTYQYNASNQIQSITTKSVDTAVNFSNIEVHEWKYNLENKPIQMLKIKNGRDTTYIDFILDDKGNVVEEQWKRNNKTQETFYYYYNDKNALTDVVKYNSIAKKHLPDYIFEYDADGKIVKTIQTTKGGNYFIWLISYNSKGLKQTEECYNKQKQLTGKVVYQYQ